MGKLPSHAFPRNRFSFYFFSAFLVIFLSFSLPLISAQENGNDESKPSVMDLGRRSKANGKLVGLPVDEMIPLVEASESELEKMVNESRRKLVGSFQICALCTCCGGGGGGLCLSSPCCYAINCNIPNRPFGLCSFTPKTCNCFGCHL